MPTTGSRTTRRIHPAVCAGERCRRRMSTIPRAQTIASGMRMKTQTAVDAAMTVKLYPTYRSWDFAVTHGGDAVHGCIHALDSLNGHQPNLEVRGCEAQAESSSQRRCC